ncbi:MAG: acyl-CoA dehydrogenase family protein [Oscillospiraceae bacterium]
MSYFLTEEQTLMRNSIREFAQSELKARAAEIDSTEKFPMDIWKRCAELGLTGITVKEEYGGLGLTCTDEMVMMEELGKVSPAVGLILDAHLYALMIIQYSDNEAMKKKYLEDGATGRKIFALSATDPAGASNMAQWSTFGADTGENFVLNGNKIFCTNSHIADVYVCMALSATGLDEFVIEKGTPGLETGFIEHKTGLRGTNSGNVSYKNVVIPKENVIVHPLAPQCNCVALLDMSMLAVGAAEEAHRRTVEYLGSRMRGENSLLSRGAVSYQLAEMLLDIEMCKNMIYTVAKLMDEGRPVVPLHNIIKGFIPHRMTNWIGKCIELNGAVGYSEDTGLTMLWRDALGCTIADGAATVSTIQGAQYMGWGTID